MEAVRIGGFWVSVLEGLRLCGIRASGLRVSGFRYFSYYPKGPSTQIVGFPGPKAIQSMGFVT